jgi:hypothetical protein
MAQRVYRFSAIASLTVVIAALGGYIAHAAISLSTSTAYTQSFDGMVRRRRRRQLYAAR